MGMTQIFYHLVPNGTINGSARAADRNVIIVFHQFDVPSNEQLTHDKGVIQNGLSRDFKFSQKKRLTFESNNNNATIAFIPYGKRCGIGYLTINRYRK